MKPVLSPGRAKEPAALSGLQTKQDESRQPRAPPWAKDCRPLRGLKTGTRYRDPVLEGDSRPDLRATTHRIIGERLRDRWFVARRLTRPFRCQSCCQQSQFPQDGIEM